MAVPLPPAEVQQLAEVLRRVAALPLVEAVRMPAAVQAFQAMQASTVVRAMLNAPLGSRVTRCCDSVDSRVRQAATARALSEPVRHSPREENRSVSAVRRVCAARGRSAVR